MKIKIMSNAGYSFFKDVQFPIVVNATQRNRCCAAVSTYELIKVVGRGTILDSCPINYEWYFLKDDDYVKLSFIDRVRHFFTGK